MRMSDDLLAVLVAAPWIYNVRGLVNECSALFTAAPLNGLLGTEHLSSRFWSEVRLYLRSVSCEAKRLELALRLAGDRRAGAAELLDVTERTVYRKVSRRSKGSGDDRSEALTAGRPSDDMSGSVA